MLLSKDEQEALANVMGHSDSVHKRYYIKVRFKNVF